VPALDEEARIEAALGSLRAGGVDEIIVVDGGSRDTTRARAALLADLVLDSDPGLFRQLEAGAARVSGDVLLFHYADVLFPATGRAGIERALGDPRAIGGAFRLSFPPGKTRVRLVALGARLRNRLGIGPFGDQSIFLRADAFRSLGGFSGEALLRDADLVRRARRAGRFVLLPETVVASTRRWDEKGFLRTAGSHAWFTVLHAVGARRAGSEALGKLRVR
jgi:uncharacterized protein